MNLKKSFIIKFQKKFYIMILFLSCKQEVFVKSSLMTNSPIKDSPFLQKSPPPKDSTLKVPYYYQYNNQYEPSRTCNLTVLAMVLSFYGKKITPDELYNVVGGPVFTGSEVADIAKKQGFKATYSEKGSVDLIKKYLDAGTPVILQGWFTQSGHFIVLIGYDDKEKSWIVNDPAGKWDGCYKCGYANKTSQNGIEGRYSYKAIAEAASDNDPNTYWITTITP
jgi:uncharacterized protein YvpB